MDKALNPSKLVALKVERRSLAMAIFIDQRLDYTDVRQLSSSEEKADESAVGFLNWALSIFPIGSAALEVVAGAEIRRARLNRAILDAFRGRGIPVWEITPEELLGAFGEPPLRARREVREVVLSIWPILDDRKEEPSILDAAALGLLVQTKRLFWS
jgi:hypothetical protein